MNASESCLDVAAGQTSAEYELQTDDSSIRPTIDGTRFLDGPTNRKAKV